MCDLNILSIGIEASISSSQNRGVTHHLAHDKDKDIKYMQKDT
jgi:hypothetical protein